MFSSRISAGAYNHAITCSIDSASIAYDAQNDKTVSVNVDAAYHAFGEKINVPANSLAKSHIGHWCAFPMKLHILAQCLENINPQAAMQLKNLEDIGSFKFKVLVSVEGDLNENRLDLALQQIFEERAYPIILMNKFIGEIANAVIGNQAPVYSTDILSMLREISFTVQRDPNFCTKLEERIAEIVHPQINVSVQEVKSFNYAELQVPAGCSLYKVSIGAAETFFDLGKHPTEPVKIYSATSFLF